MSLKLKPLSEQVIVITGATFGALATLGAVGAWAATRGRRGGSGHAIESDGIGRTPAGLKPASPSASLSVRRSPGVRWRPRVEAEQNSR